MDVYIITVVCVEEIGVHLQLSVYYAVVSAVDLGIVSAVNILIYIKVTPLSFRGEIVRNLLVKFPVLVVPAPAAYNLVLESPILVFARCKSNAKEKE